MQDESRQRSNDERSRTTRGALLDAARSCFSELGYAETGTPEIVRRAGVTRGALYHHFKDKAALLLGVLEREAGLILDEVETKAGAAASPREAMIAGAKSYLDAMQRDGRTRLFLIDGPAALGPARVTDLLRQGPEQGLATGLAALTGRDDLPLEMVDILSAGFDRAVLEITSGRDASAYLDAFAQLFDALAADRS